MALAGVILISWCGISYQNVYTANPLTEITATDITDEADGSHILSFDVSSESENNVELEFFTCHQFVDAYADGQLIYSLNQDAGIFGHTTGGVWNFIEIPYGTQTITIHMIPAYSEVNDQVHTYYIGRGLDIYRDIMKSSIPSLMISILIFCIGIVMLVYWMMSKRKQNIGNSLLYLGGFGILLGLWSANETNAAALIIENRIASYFAAYIFLMLMGIPFALFVRDFLQIGDKLIWKIYFILSVLEYVTVILLQLFEIQDLKQTIYFTHFILVTALMYIVGSLVYKVARHQVDRRVKISIGGMTFIVIATMTDIIAYYHHSGDSDIFGRIAFLLFIILLGWETVSNSISLIEKGYRAQEIEEMASRDALTGLFNRTAYEQDCENITSIRGMMIVTFDLNNLKECNDVYGHKAGDAYIIQASTLICRVFEPYGKCYRIGGDEFCCIIKNALTCPIEEKFERLKYLENLYNLQRENTEIYIACGYAVCDNTVDTGIESIRDRADYMMYQDKHRSKKG